MKINSTFIFTFILFFSCSWIASAVDDHDNFLACLAKVLNNNSSIVYTRNDASYPSILRFSIRNLRYATPSTPKPQVIITPRVVSQIPPVIYCAKHNALQIRTRSGGHDYEGESYAAYVPFVIVDLINMREVMVNAEEKTAWVEGGATLGSVYYGISRKSSTLGFPAGVCPTVGVGGHISGGGYGMMLRKYGLAADHVIDARIIDVNGRILDRESMGEDLFWAIRGGGGASFGIIVAWKLQLVDVPEKVTFFAIQKTLEQNASYLFDRWQQVAHQIDRNLFMSVHVRRVNPSPGKRNVRVGITFTSVYLGGADSLLQVMQKSFPELGLARQDCTELAWVQAVLSYFNLPVDNLEVLLNRSHINVMNFKAKLDYVQKPIPANRLQGIWRRFYQPEAKDAELLMIPYGGRMAEVPESAIPFPHRAGNLYKIQTEVKWSNEDAQDSGRYLNWVRSVYGYLTPYVSRSPRVGYLNYRDFDFGTNPVRGNINYAQASRWGRRYFKANFDRLVRVKSRVDPTNFFRNEQSIPVVL